MRRVRSLRCQGEGDGQMRWLPIFPTEDSRNPTMERMMLVDTKPVGVYLHRFPVRYRQQTIDGHDHPWSFLFLVLSGGYDETRLGRRTERRRRWSCGFRCADAVHRLAVHRDGCITLCIRGPERRKWGWRTV
jgi:hypothetical protein